MSNMILQETFLIFFTVLMPGVLSVHAPVSKSGKKKFNSDENLSFHSYKSSNVMEKYALFWIK